MKREDITFEPIEVAKNAKSQERNDSDTTQRIELSSDVKELFRGKKKKSSSLIVQSGEEIGRVIPIGNNIGDKIVIGRHPDCDTVLRDDGISRRHAEVIQVGEGKILIHDLGSTNGIFLKGAKVEKAVVADGEKFLLGQRIILRYAYQDTIDESYVQGMYETATRDGLTNAFNRKFFFQRMKTDLSFTRRHRIPLTVFMLDIDHFKKVNDTYGHQTGDQTLILLTSALTGAIRTEDMLARYGGEEFSILAPGTPTEGAKVLGERIRTLVSLVEIPIIDNPGEILHITISLGGATASPNAIINADQLISKADDCLYQAKRSGRNKVICTEVA